jgi:hypothetical protein
LAGWIEENINQDSQYPGKDDNQAPPKDTVMPACLVLVSETYRLFLIGPVFLSISILQSYTVIIKQTAIPRKFKILPLKVQVIMKINKSAVYSSLLCTGLHVLHAKFGPYLVRSN